MRARTTVAVTPLHNGQWWVSHTSKLSFRHPDANDADSYNRLLWKGIVGDGVAFPEHRSGQDLSLHRDVFLKAVSTPIGSGR
jgi:hypothetical protein